MSTRNCDNCNTAYGPDDMFCENCGYDFITGSLPIDVAGGPVPATPSVPTPSGANGPPAAPSVLSPAGPTAEGHPSAGAGSSAATDGETGQAGTPPAPEGDGVTAAAVEVARLRVVIAVDREFFDEVVNDGEIDFPTPAPAETELDLAGPEVHIGRTSESRAIHPDIDVAAVTGDQAVSSRHAVLRRADDGGLTIVDVGSTNGTFLASVDSDPITQGVPVEVQRGTPVYVGAWTRIVVVE